MPRYGAGARDPPFQAEVRENKQNLDAIFKPVLQWFRETRILAYEDARTDAIKVARPQVHFKHS